MSTAAGGETKAHEAVIETSPPNNPLHAIDMSGFRYRSQRISRAVTVPAALASIVLAAIIPMRESEAARVEPALKPNHPNARISVPATAIGRVCPGMAPIG